MKTISKQTIEDFFEMEMSDALYEGLTQHQEVVEGMFKAHKYSEKLFDELDLKPRQRFDMCLHMVGYGAKQVTEYQKSMKEFTDDLNERSNKRIAKMKHDHKLKREQILNED